MRSGAAPQFPLSPKSELGDQRSISLDVVPSEIVEQPAPSADEHEQSAARVVILVVDPQVLREMVDPPGEQGNLYLRGTGVGFVETVLGDRGGSVGHGPVEPCFSELFGE